MQRMTLLLLLVLTALRGPALADGKVFPPVATPAEVRIPDQRALIAWNNGIERLVVETRFIGTGTNFAWVVPLPAIPRVEPASPGLFPTLEHLLQPHIIHAPGNGWIAALGVSALVFALAWRPNWVQQPLQGPVLLALVVLALGSAMLLPSLSKASAGGVGADTDPVQILSQQQAGVFETTVVSSRDPAALRDWLRSQGFHLPASTEPVIRDYLRDGWVFAASRVRRDAANPGPAAIHPLRFTFPAQQPVYPLRLTGVDNGNLDVELFVLGPERARIPRFRVLDSRPAFANDSLNGSSFNFRYGVPWDHLPILQSHLQDCAQGTLWATRLEASLSPSQMESDATVGWDGFQETREVLYSARGAWTTAANWTGPLVSLALILVALRARLARWTRPRILQWTAGVVAGTAVCTATAVAFLPVVPVRLSHRFQQLNAVKHQRLALQLAVMDGMPTNAPMTVQSVRQAIQREFPRQLALLGEAVSRFRIREEESPFNYTLRPGTNGVDLIFHDGWGGVAEVLPLEPTHTASP